MTEAEREGSTYVVPVETVQRAFTTLMSRRIHNFFPGYLSIRKEAIETGTATSLRPRYEDMGSLLRVAGATADKPFLRPFTLQEDPTSAWMNKNLAGSWAPSSVREGQAPRHVVTPGGNGTWNLLENHAALALEHLLFDAPLDVYALSLFLYRDYGFRPAVSGAPTTSEVVHAFLEAWKFFRDDGSAHPDTSVLFTFNSNELDQPLEQFPQPAQDGEQ